jgi:hypothetical protein
LTRFPDESRSADVAKLACVERRAFEANEDAVLVEIDNDMGAIFCPPNHFQNEYKKR